MSYKSGRSFTQALQLGLSGEKYVHKLLRNAGLTCRPNDEKSRLGKAGWDLEVELDNGPVQLEIKFDAMESVTGNVAIEYFNPRAGVPSGLGATTATLWVVVFSNLSAFVCRVADLKDFVRRVKPGKVASYAGDGNAELWLYARDVILPALFYPMDDLSPTELRALFGELTT